MMRIALVFFCIFLSSCTIGNNGIQLIGYNWQNIFSSSNPSSITVRKGDTLYSLSRKYSVPNRELIEVNRLQPPYTLFVGRVLRIPQTKYHIVSKGDTFYNVSKRYNIEMSSLAKLNDIDEPYALNIGQRLVLPGSVVSNSKSNYYKSSTVAGSNQRTWTPEPAAYAPPKPRKSKFMWPVKGPIISSYGPIAKGRNNDGINIKAPRGTTVKAADSGTIAYAGNELKGFGNLVLIKHNDGWVTAYAHNDQLYVKKGQKVVKGEKISTVGTTGGVNTPQLHFEIRAGKKALNPKSYL